MLNEKVKVGDMWIENRVVCQPMEGCDCNEDGSPSQLTENKYIDYAKSGAGIIWFEANAVCKEGRTNPRQMFLTEDNVDNFLKLTNKMREISLKENGYQPVLILQLTHSGRQSMAPMIAYHNDIYEEKRPMSDENIVTDEYLDNLHALYAKSALLAIKAGFDGVDVKSCHGYLFQELLSAYNRPGRYGGSFENRTRCLIDSVKAVKAVVPSNFLVTTRLGLCDMVKKPFGFGTNEQGEIDLTEPKLLIKRLMDLGEEIINITIGNPYFNPHVNRPFRVGNYTPPEKPEVGLERFRYVEKEIKKTFPDLKVVASGVSYYRNDLMEKSEDMIDDGVCDFVGYGRSALAYPMFYRDYLSGNFDGKKCCVACSKCTFLMRAKTVSGCATFNEYYKKLFKEMGL